MTEEISVVAKVAQAHIDLGLKMSCEKCPIALALLDLFPKATRIIVGVLWITVDIDGGRIRSDTTRDAEEFIRKFDGGCKVQPSEFALTFKPVKYYMT